VVAIHNPDTGASFYARPATGGDVALGERLAGELRELMEKVTNDRLAVLKEIPANYRRDPRRPV
jgi:hypothetical protein